MLTSFPPFDALHQERKPTFEALLVVLNPRGLADVMLDVAKFILPKVVEREGDGTFEQFTIDSEGRHHGKCCTWNDRGVKINEQTRHHGHYTGTETWWYHTGVMHMVVEWGDGGQMTETPEHWHWDRDGNALSDCRVWPNTPDVTNQEVETEE